MKKGKKLREDTHVSPTLSGAGRAWSRYLYTIQKRSRVGTEHSVSGFINSRRAVSQTTE